MHNSYLGSGHIPGQRGLSYVDLPDIGYDKNYPVHQDDDKDISEY